MAEFQMVAKNLERLCDTYRSSSKCGTDECPLYCEDLCYTQMIAHILGDDAGRLEDVVMSWAAEHPEPVYPTWGEWFVQTGDLPQNYGTTEFGLRMAELLKVMATPIPADIAQKLGIEPKEDWQ